MFESFPFVVATRRLRRITALSAMRRDPRDVERARVRSRHRPEVGRLVSFSSLIHGGQAARLDSSSCPRPRGTNPSRVRSAHLREARDVRSDARRAPRRAPPGPHPDVHRGDVDHARPGDRREHGDLQHHQQRPPQAAALPRAGSARGPVADGTRRQHRRPQPLDRRLRHLSRRVPHAGGRRHLERQRVHGNRRCRAGARGRNHCHLPPVADARRPAEPRPAFRGARRRRRESAGGDAQSWLLAATVRKRSRRRRAPDHGRWHRPRDHRRSAKRFLVHGRDTRPRAAAPLRACQGAARRIQLPGDWPASSRSQHRGGKRGRRPHDRHRARQVPAARRHEREDDGGRTARRRTSGR